MTCIHVYWKLCIIICIIERLIIYIVEGLNIIIILYIVEGLNWTFKRVKYYNIMHCRRVKLGV